MSNYVHPKILADEKLQEWVKIFKADMNKMNTFFYSKLEELEKTKNNLIDGFTSQFFNDTITDDGQSQLRGAGIHRKFGEEKGRLEHATSWNRAFHNLFT
jgi:hypothetical protein